VILNQCETKTPQTGVRGCPPFWDLWGSNPRAYIALGLKSLHSDKIPTLGQNPYTRTKSLFTSLFCHLHPTAFAIYCVCHLLRLPSTAFAIYCVCHLLRLCVCAIYILLCLCVCAIYCVCHLLRLSSTAFASYDVCAIYCVCVLRCLCHILRLRPTMFVRPTKKIKKLVSNILI
jgi:hypothetical protein